MRIRTTFLAGFVAVALPGLVDASWQASTAWRAWGQANAAARTTAVIRDVQRAETAIATEMGQILVSTIAAKPDQKLLDSTRQASETLLSAAFGSATAAGLDVTPIRDTQAALASIRDALPPYVASPPAARDPAFRARITEQRNQNVARLVGLADNATRRVASVAPALSLAVDLANQSMDVRDYVGRRSLMLNAWVGAETIPAEQVVAADKLTGAVEHAWTSAQRVAETLRVPQIAAELAHQREVFAGRDEPRWQRLVEIGRQRSGGPAESRAQAWPEDIAGFRAWSLPAQASILALRDAAFDYAVTEGQALSRAARTAFLLDLGLVAMVLACSIGSIALLMRRVVSPLQVMTGAVEQIAAGDLEAAVPGRARRDELGTMAGAIETLRVASVERAHMAAEQIAAQQAKAAEADRVNALLREFEQDAAAMLHTVTAAATELAATTGELSDAAEAGLHRATAAASATTLASGNVQTVAASAEELSASIAEVARQVSHGADIARRAAGKARETDATIAGLRAAATHIGEVVQVISGIANQTNLLALNATIEAARAGEAGKGFAVVAQEVKNLALETAKATGEIGAQIAAMQGETERTVEAIAAIGRTIDEMDSTSAAASAAAEQQAAATEEIGRAVIGAATGTREAAEHAGGMRQGAERTGASAAELRTAAGGLAREADAMRGKVERFLARIRTA